MTDCSGATRAGRKASAAVLYPQERPPSEKCRGKGKAAGGWKRIREGVFLGGGRQNGGWDRPRRGPGSAEDASAIF